MWGRKKRARAQDPPPDASYWASPQPTAGTSFTTSRIVVNGKQVDPNSPEGQEALRLAQLVQDGTLQNGAAIPVDGPLAGAAPASATPGGGLDERYTELERIARLHASGALTDEEFAAEKRRILGS